MLKSITIENFKGISEPVRIDLRPITLLFGMNSAGKSSLLHALIYAREVFERHNLDADQTLTAGDALDLGGFRTLVHGHDLSRHIRLRFDIDLSDIDLSTVYAPAFPRREEINPILETLSGKARNAAVTVEIRYDAHVGRPVVSRYAIEINGNHLAAICYSSERQAVEVVDKAIDHPLFEIPDWDGHLAWIDEMVPGTAPIDSFSLHGQHDALPAWDRCLLIDIGLPPSASDAGDNPGGHAHATETYGLAGRAVAVLSTLLVGPGVMVRDALRHLRYLGPQRQIPTRDYTPPRAATPSRWASGLAGWDLLHERPPLVERVSRLLSDEKRMNLGYLLNLVEFHEFDAQNPLLTAVRADRLDDLPDPAVYLKKVMAYRRLVFRPMDSPDVYLEPADLGVGVGQMIPVMAAALDDQALGSATLATQLIAVEHPELNLHPRLQAEMADVFLEGALSEATKGRIIFIETHSESLTLRFLRRIREQSKGKPWLSLKVTPPDVGIWYVDRSAGVVTVKRIQVDVEGEFVEPWPEDDTLFEQDFRERYS